MRARTAITTYLTLHEDRNKSFEKIALKKDISKPLKAMNVGIAHPTVVLLEIIKSN
jgi:hypothetical protein